MDGMRRPWAVYSPSPFLLSFSHPAWPIFTQLFKYYSSVWQPPPPSLSLSLSLYVFLLFSFFSSCIWIIRKRQQTGIHELVPVSLSTGTLVGGSDRCSTILILSNLLSSFVTKFTIQLYFFYLIFLSPFFSHKMCSKVYYMYYFLLLESSSLALILFQLFQQSSGFQRSRA